MADPFSISEAQLVSSWLATIFWSFFLVTFVQCLRALLLDEWGTEFRRPSTINWAMVAVSVSFFVFGTLDVVLGFYHNIKAFILFTGPGGSEAEFTQLSDWVNVLKVRLQTTFVERLIYRLWVVYSHSWKIVPIPLLLWLGTAACAGGILFGEITSVTGTVGNTNIKNFIIPLWTCSITMNIVATSLLVYRIIKVDRRNSENGVLSLGSYVPSSHTKKRKSRLQRLTFIIVESGLMYTTMALITFITVLVSNSNASYPTSDVEVQVVGIAFNLIIIRVADRGARDKTLYTIQYPSQSLPLSRIDQERSMTKGVHVIVARETDQDHTGSLQYGLSSDHKAI
ncbi:hypothetical protein GALMADRAFT_80539 [Galerina marginata CBS 339.88]|uniref:Uncharacterized protein n=1 Tax=Galerina marginata (strain CBS 339.88) TaxID=685588 RepID=A0A067S792_GALM3|nr:hypothetical protein GALMADRAFT_80539 [Galerina marginata CBS 339.88]